MLRLGVCCGIDHVEAIAAAGFDYIEGGFGWLAGLSEPEFRDLLKKSADAPIGFEAFNGMLPGTFRLTGEAADLTPVRPFIRRGFERAARLGGRVVVFGSGGARHVPEGFPIARAYEQLGEYLYMVEKEIAPFGITLAVEPLRAQECNIFNYVSECAAFARHLNLPHIRVLADQYHMYYLDEGAAAIEDAGALMAHCHIANPIERIFPAPGDEFDYAPFFLALHRIGYTGRVSVEAGCKDYAADSKRAYEALSKLA